ncbi:MAG: MlaA family lipoprotein, partial [Woeseiaceae bacterium]
MPGPVDRLAVVALLVSICLHLGACATSGTSHEASQAERSPADPWEGMNRSIYKFNENIDKIIYKPLARGYEAIIPKFARRGIGNFSQNLRAPLNIINHFLQGKPRDGFGQTGRFLVNSTIGLFGLID